MPIKDEAVAAIKVDTNPDSPEASQHPAAAPDPDVPPSEPAASAEAKELRRVQRLLWAVVVFFALGVLYYASPVFMPIAAGLLLSFLFKPIVRKLVHYHVAPPVSAMLIMGVLFCGLVFGVSAASDSMKGWLESMPQAADQLETKFREFGSRFREINRATEKIGDIASGNGGPGEPIPADPTDPGAPTAPTEPPEPAPVPVEVRSAAFPSVVLSTTASMVAGLTVTLVLAYFFLASGDLLLRQLVQVLPSLPEKREAVEAWRDLESHVSTYLVTVTIINAGLGLATWGLLWLFGVPYAMWWGLTAAVFNFIPYIGPLVVTVAIFLAGVLAFESIGQAVFPPLAFIGMQTIEGYFITPMIVGRRMSLNPLVLFMWLVIWSWMWGIVGSLLAVPMLISFKIVCDHVAALEPVSNLLSGYVRRAGEGGREEEEDKPAVEAAKPGGPAEAPGARAVPSQG